MSQKPLLAVGSRRPQNGDFVWREQRVEMARGHVRPASVDREGTHERLDAGRQRMEIVSTFQRRHQSAMTEACRQIPENTRSPRKILRLQSQPRERVRQMRIESGRHQNQVRSMRLQRR